jgi:hypothetical protein
MYFCDSPTAPGKERWRRVAYHLFFHVLRRTTNIETDLFSCYYLPCDDDDDDDGGGDEEDDGPLRFSSQLEDCIDAFVLPPYYPSCDGRDSSRIPGVVAGGKLV